ncbi:MAG: hypothetical protein A4E48_02750 [Methanosaeta sp. PtaU1.Bin060]|nr:MAG: hypothetical protein A4E48_02750 [Methanosaeta sp. PtaU1.Bin060]
MVDYNRVKKRRGVTLRTPDDVRRVVQRIISKAFQEGKELEYSGRVAQLLAVWIKAMELDKLAEIEKRLAALEAR